MTPDGNRLTVAELEAEEGFALPDKQVISLLNVDVDLDVALDLAAPIDLAVAANANVALPVNASVSADVLTIDSSSASQATQSATIEQALSGDAIAEAPQTAVVDQSGTDLAAGAGGGSTSAGAAAPAVGGVGTAAAPTGAVGGTADAITGAVEDVTGSVDGLVGSAGSLLDDGLLNINVDAAVDADLAAPVAGAVAANANVAAPISAAVSANVGSIGSQSVAIADQTAVITQSLTDVTAQATAAQDATVKQ